MQGRKLLSIIALMTVWVILPNLHLIGHNSDHSTHCDYCLNHEHSKTITPPIPIRYLPLLATNNNNTFYLNTFLSLTKNKQALQRGPPLTT